MSRWEAARVLRIKVRYRCGAEAVLEYPEEAAAAVLRLVDTARREDCPSCQGEARRSGAFLQVENGVHLWRWRDVTDDVPDGEPVS